MTTVTALRISTGRSTEPIGSDLPVIKDALGHPLIPGASFEGARSAAIASPFSKIPLVKLPYNYDLNSIST